MSSTDSEDDDNLELLPLPQPHKPLSLLPIAQFKPQLLYTIESHQVTIIIGETGSGKTTQLPQFLLDAGFCSNGGDAKQLAITQPRRIAATSVAARVAEERGGMLGQEVGYSIRFEDVTSENTRVKFVTDGLLLREMLVDPLLRRYSVIMVDEAHERSLSSDVLLSLLKKVARKRKDLRIVVSSATLDAERFLEFFAPDEGEVVHAKSKEEYGRIVGIQGRAHPVEIQYLKEPASEYVEAAVQAVWNIHQNEGEGDILVFLTGREEIDSAIELLGDHIADLPPSHQKLSPLPLYAGLSTEDQLFVFQKSAPNTRKVIFSTNIAEASVTIDGIVFVVDSGFVKLRSYDAHTGIDTLAIVPVSQASATQRAGRAGRTRPGKCFRLYTESAFHTLEPATFPEIQRSNLAPVILQLLNLGITNVVRFDYLSAPPSILVIRALDILYALDAIDANARLTKPLGTRMAELPLEPHLAKALLAAANPPYDCIVEMLSIAAMLTLDGDAFVSHAGGKKQVNAARRRFAAQEGDHLTLYNVYTAFVAAGTGNIAWCRENCLNHKALLKASSVRKQLAAYLTRFGISVPLSHPGPEIIRAGGTPLPERIRRCLATAFFTQAARMTNDGSFVLVDGKTRVWAHPSSVFFHRKVEWVVFSGVLGSGEKVWIRDLSSVEVEWLVEGGGGWYRVREGKR